MVQNTMGRVVKIPWIRGQNTVDSDFNIPLVQGSKYHGKAGQNTMDRGVKIPWVGVPYTMGRGVKLAWKRGSIYYGEEVKIPWEQG
jgi:hypothetical protein